MASVELVDDGGRDYPLEVDYCGLCTMPPEVTGSCELVEEFMSIAIAICIK